MRGHLLTSSEITGENQALAVKGAFQTLGTACADRLWKQFIEYSARPDLPPLQWPWNRNTTEEVIGPSSDSSLLFFLMIIPLRLPLILSPP